MQKKRKKWYWLLAGLLILLLGAGGAWRYFHVDTKGTVARGSAEAAAVQGKKSLIVYFTYSENIGSTDGMNPDAVTSASLHGEYVNPEGNMQVMVRELQKRTGADTYPIVVKDPYPMRFEKMSARARKEIQEAKDVPLRDPVPDLSAYDVIYLGTPIWWYDLPAPVSMFLKKADLSGKTVVPFGIHRGSGFSDNLNHIQALQPGIKMTDGFTIDAKAPNETVRIQFAAFLAKLP